MTRPPAPAATVDGDAVTLDGTVAWAPTPARPTSSW